MKILSFIPTKDTIHPRCLSALYNQDVNDHAVLIHALDPIKLHDDPEKNRYLNIARNRNILRDMVLASDAEWFLSVDGDTVLPPNAISDFMRVGQKLMGGWYKKFGISEWVSARVIAKDTYYCFFEPQPGVVPVDMVGLGCAMLHRSVLEKVPFDGGIDKLARNARGDITFFGECLQFGQDCKKNGFQAYMIPTIICEHIDMKTGKADPVPQQPL